MFPSVDPSRGSDSALQRARRLRVSESIVARSKEARYAAGRTRWQAQSSPGNAGTPCTTETLGSLVFLAGSGPHRRTQNIIPMTEAQSSTAPPTLPPMMSAIFSDESPLSPSLSETRVRVSVDDRIRSGETKSRVHEFTPIGTAQFWANMIRWRHARPDTAWTIFQVSSPLV